MTITDEQVEAACEAQSKFRMRWSSDGKAMIVYDERGEEPVEIGRYESREDAGDAVLWHGQRAALEASERAKAPHAIDPIVERAKAAAHKAMIKFPQPNYVALKIAEEAGEVVRGCVHFAEKRMEWHEVEGEIVQLIAMLIRLVTEGDQINGVFPPKGEA